MKNLGISFFHRLMMALCFAANVAYAIAPASDMGFMTPKDLASLQSTSNITLKNNSHRSRMVYGLYIRQFASVLPGQSCNSAIAMYNASGNVAAGSVVMPVTLKAHGEAPVGGNYLYNMIYGANYYIRVTIPASPPGCALPGCTWGADTSLYHWCIYLGALAPVSTTGGYTANVPPSTTLVSGGGYNYDLVNQYAYLGPLSCNDETLTCAAATPQSQSFS